MRAAERVPGKVFADCCLPHMSGSASRLAEVGGTWENTWSLYQSSAFEGFQWAELGSASPGKIPAPEMVVSGGWVCTLVS